MIPQSGARPFVFRNDSGQTIPPWSCLKITGADQDDDGLPFLTADQPDATGIQFAFSLGAQVADGGFGYCVFPTVPVWATYTGSAPATGSYAGPSAGAWTLDAGNAAVEVVGSTTNSETDNLVLVQLPSPPIYYLYISLFGNPQGGSFILNIGYPDSSDVVQNADITIAYNAAASDVKTAFEAHPELSASDITVTGGPLPNSDAIVSLSNGKSVTKITLNSTDDSGLYGGSFYPYSYVRTASP